MNATFHNALRSELPIFAACGSRSNALTSFSKHPLDLASARGGMISAVAIDVVVWVAVGALLDPGRGVLGYGSLMAVLEGLAKLLSIGLVGAYLGRGFHESKGRLLYAACYGMNLKSPRDIR